MVGKLTTPSFTVYTNLPYTSSCQRQLPLLMSGIPPANICPLPAPQPILMPPVTSCLVVGGSGEAALETRGPGRPFLLLLHPDPLQFVFRALSGSDLLIHKSPTSALAIYWGINIEGKWTRPDISWETTGTAVKHFGEEKQPPTVLGFELASSRAL